MAKLSERCVKILRYKARNPKLKTRNCKPKPAADNVDSTAQGKPTKGAAILPWRNFAHFFANVASKSFAIDTQKAKGYQSSKTHHP